MVVPGSNIIGVSRTVTNLDRIIRLLQNQTPRYYKTCIALDLITLYASTQTVL